MSDWGAEDGDAGPPLPLAGGAGGGPVRNGGKFRPRNTKRARELRQQMSPAERLLWSRVRARQLGGFHFTKQCQVGPFYTDFACRKPKLAVELDGFSHESRQGYDAGRDRYFKSEGWQVMRFTNDETLNNIDGVLIAIELALRNRPSPNPSRKREGNT